MQGMLTAHQQKWLGITFMRQYSMNEEEEKMCAVGKNPVLACPWAKAKDLFIVHLLPLPKNF